MKVSSKLKLYLAAPPQFQTAVTLSHPGTTRRDPVSPTRAREYRSDIATDSSSLRPISKRPPGDLHPHSINRSSTQTKKLTCGGVKVSNSCRKNSQPLVVHIVVPEAVRPPHPSREAYSLRQNLKASH
uniref:Orf127b n=1 Tax=Batis maritima TaxID=4436 RepID=A0A068BF38_BATMA|nr:orf127b [Batis maritima]AIC83324.1 orf127b [Batis maritima]